MRKLTKLLSVIVFTLTLASCDVGGMFQIDSTVKASKDGGDATLVNVTHPFSFTSDSDRSGIFYLRVCSYGDYDGNENKWGSAPAFDASNISENSINPMEYTADKLLNAFDSAGIQCRLETTTFKFNAKANLYPVVSYEYGNTRRLDSDSYSINEVETDEYTVHSVYAYTTEQLLNEAKSAPFSNEAITSDEINYRRHAKAYYTNVDSKYDDVLNRIIADGHFNDFSFDNPDLKQIVGVRNYMFSNYECNPTISTSPSYCDPLEYFLSISKSGGLMSFATATTLIYRKLSLPARIVSGYLCAVYEPGVDTAVNPSAATYWTEVYVSGIGWVNIDPGIEALARGPIDNLTDGSGN